MLGRNDGDLFIRGRLIVWSSGDPDSDVEALHRLIVGSGFGPIRRHPQISKTVRFGDGEHVKVFRLYRLDRHGLVYVGRRLDRAWLVTCLTKLDVSSRREMQSAFAALEGPVGREFNGQRIEVSNQFGMLEAK